MTGLRVIGFGANRSFGVAIEMTLALCMGTLALGYWIINFIYVILFDLWEIRCTYISW